MTSRFRSRVLQVPVLNTAGIPGALDVDALRRRDGLDLETAFRRQDDVLGDTEPGKLLEMSTLLELLREYSLMGRPLCRYAGTTPGAVGDMTTRRSRGVTPLPVTNGQVDFQLDQPAPSTDYTCTFVGIGATAPGAQVRIENPTLTSFRLRFSSVSGGLTRADTTVFTFSFMLFDGSDA